MKIFRTIALCLGALLFLSLAACTRPPANPAPDDAAYAVTLGQTSLFLLVGDPSLGQANLSANVLREGEITDMVPTFHVKNHSVAEVDETGKVTAKKYGRTTVTASYGDASATAEIAVYEKADAERINSFSEEYINLFGRTYQTEGAVHFDNPATGFEVSFMGASLTADVTVEGPMANKTDSGVYVCVYVDGGEPTRMRLEADEAFPLADGLGEGIHTVRVLKSSEIDYGAYCLHALNAAQFLRTQEKSELKIEFIGDSITAGYGALAEGGTWSIENTDACSAYACLTAQTLGADFSVVAYSGICVKANLYSNNHMTDMYTYTSLRTKQPYAYDPETDIIVLNLGTNDANFIARNPAYGANFPQDYLAFVADLRNIYPSAYILCLYGMMGKNSTVDAGIASAVDTLADEKIVYLNNFRQNNIGADGHPGTFAHMQYAQQLTKYIQDLL